MCYNTVMLTVVLARKVRFIMNMETKNVIEKIKKAVHRPINFKDFKSPCTRANTNCFALAIGSTVTADKTLYQLGRISGSKKPLDERFFSIEEVKDSFLADLEALDLKYESLDLLDKNQILEYTSRLKLKKNEHIVVMFVGMISEIITDFHFLRFDYRGWSEKRGFTSFLTGENVSWPCDLVYKLVGCYNITR